MILLFWINCGDTDDASDKKMRHICTGTVKISCLIFFPQTTNESGVDVKIPVQFQNNKVFSCRSTEEQM